MVSEWPIRAESRGRATREAIALARPDAWARRLTDAATDLFLPQAHRITDRLRASMSSMLDGVTAAVERDMRKAILPHFAHRAELAASLSSASVGIALPLLADACTLRHPPLIAIVLRRAEGFVLSRRLAPGGGGDGGDGGSKGLPLDDSDHGIAAAALALRVAEARRVDRFGEAALLFDDLPAELAGWLVWHVAAALRRYLIDHHEVDDSETDAILAQAAQAVLAGHDEGRGLHAAGAGLAARLVAEDRIDGELLAELLRTGQVTAFAAVLASAAAISPDEVWPIVADPADGRLAILLRAAGISRETAAAILFLIVVGTADAAAEIDLFDACTPDEAQDALDTLRLPAEYRAAIGTLDAALAVAWA